MIPNVKCGTESGILLEFDYVEVVYRPLPSSLHTILKHHGPFYEDLFVKKMLRMEMNEMCSSRELQVFGIEKKTSLSLVG